MILFTVKAFALNTRKYISFNANNKVGENTTYDKIYINAHYSYNDSLDSSVRAKNSLSHELPHKT